MRLVGLGVMTLFLSCGQDKVTYSLLFADDARILVHQKEIAKTNFDGELENGTWSHELNSVVYSKGTWDKGHKVGTWEYNTGESQFMVSFETYKSAITNFQVSYPNHWKVYEKLDPSAAFAVSDTTELGDKRTKLFIVLVHDKMDLGQTLGEFNNYYNEAMSTDSILARQHVKVVGTNREYYLNMYIIKKYGEELLAFNLLGESADFIYDISYKTRNENPEEKLLKFLEISLTARLGQLRLLDPLDKIEKIEQVETKPLGTAAVISHADKV